MSVKNTVLVMAFEGIRPTVDRHRKYWEAVGDVTYVVGQVDPLQGEYGLQFAYGPAEHHGFASNRKVLEALKWAIRGFPTNVVFAEYDALIMRPYAYWKDRVPKDAIWCPSFSDTRANRGFVGTTFCHPPIIMNHRMACHLAHAMEEIGPGVEEGFFDRYIGYAAEQFGIKIQNMWDDGTCYTQNTISGAFVDEACEYAKRGAFCFHGIKDETTLRRIEACLPEK